MWAAGDLLSSFATGVGHTDDPDAVAAMWRTKGASWNSFPPHSIPERV